MRRRASFGHLLSPTAGSFLSSRLAEVASYATTRSTPEGRHPESRRPCGIGIDAALLPSEFDLFPQASASIELIHHSQGVMGIRRTLVRSQLEKHSGSNTAHSAGRGQRSRFADWTSLAAAP